MGLPHPRDVKKLMLEDVGSLLGRERENYEGRILKYKEKLHNVSVQEVLVDQFIKEVSSDD